jgi:hypothetical protein
VAGYMRVTRSWTAGLAHVGGVVITESESDRCAVQAVGVGGPFSGIKNQWLCSVILVKSHYTTTLSLSNLDLDPLVVLDRFIGPQRRP